MNIRAHKLDVVDPRHALRGFCVARHRPDVTATGQQRRNQMAADKTGSAGNQYLHSTFNSGTAITKRPSH
ncbi:hypothetical protein D3C81_2051470 [compost metagenome]